MSGDTVIRNRLEVVVKPLAPTHVWSGKRAIAGIDAVLISDRSLCLIDFEKLPHEIIAKHMNKDPDLRAIAKEAADSGACVRRLSVTDEAANELRRRLRRQSGVGPEVRLLSNELIPATTLKGYIRTAIMFQILQSMNKQKLKETLEAGINLYTAQPKSVSIGLEGIIFRKPRNTKAKGSIDIMQKVLISGPDVKSADVALHIFRVYKNLRMAIRPLAEAFVEAIREGELRYRINYFVNIDNTEKISDNHLILKLVRKYGEVYNIDVLEGLALLGCEILTDELDRVERIAELSHYAEKLRQWLGRYCSNRKGECVIGRLGFMTGHQAKTIMLLIRREHPELYKEITSYMSQKVGRVWDSLTLKLTPTEEGPVGTGWCEICMKRV